MEEQRLRIEQANVDEARVRHAEVLGGEHGGTTDEVSWLVKGQREP